MTESNAPIFIIVGALVSITSIVIATGILHDFASDGGEHQDIRQFNSLLNTIESQCEEVETVDGGLQPFINEEVDLREAEIKIDADDKILTYDPGTDGDSEPQEEINCGPEITIDLSFENGDEGIIPIGNHNLRAGRDGDKVEVTDY